MNLSSTIRKNKKIVYLLITSIVDVSIENARIKFNKKMNSLECDSRGLKYAIRFAYLYGVHL